MRKEESNAIKFRMKTRVANVWDHQGILARNSRIRGVIEENRGVKKGQGSRGTRDEEFLVPSLVQAHLLALVVWFWPFRGNLKNQKGYFFNRDCDYLILKTLVIHDFTIGFMAICEKPCLLSITMLESVKDLIQIR